MRISYWNRRTWIAVALTALAGSSLAAYPDKPIKLVVGYAPGGATDIVARVLSQQLSVKWGQQVVVENKPGASGMIAAEQIARAAPDGYTLLLGYTPEVSINKLVYKKLRYDPIKDLTPIALAAQAPLVLAAGPRFAYKDLQEMIQNKSTNLSFGSPGAGGQQHIAGEMLSKLTNVPMTHVPYRGTAPAISDLLGGQIDLFFGTTPPLLQHVKAGKIKILAIAGPKREALLPDVPTTTELGLPKLQLSNWFGVFGPNGMPTETLERIRASVVSALEDPKVAKQLQDQGLTPDPLSGKPLRDFIDSEMHKYTEIIQQTGISAE